LGGGGGWVGGFVGAKSVEGVWGGGGGGGGGGEFVDWLSYRVLLESGSTSGS